MLKKRFVSCFKSFFIWVFTREIDTKFLAIENMYIATSALVLHKFSNLLAFFSGKNQYL